MERFEGKVAVVTGAASGIGFALASKLGELGMRIAAADVEVEALGRAERALRERGIEAIGVATDVRSAASVRALADRTLAAFGAVHVVCNNAGVFAGGLCWEVPVEDWEWVLGVNLLGVIHGIRTFVPLLLAHGEDGHIVNTASMAALTSLPFAAPYVASKHAVLALSESLQHELALRQARIGVSALCPEAVATRISDAERNRPADLRGGPRSDAPERAMIEKALGAAVSKGVPPARIAERVVDAIRARRFYVLSDDDWRRASEVRHEDIRLGRNPTLAPPGA